MAKKREWQKKKKPMGVEPFDVRKAEAHRKGSRVYRENPIMHNTYTDKFEKWLRKQLGGKKREIGKKMKKAGGGKIMQGYKAGGKV